MKFTIKNFQNDGDNKFVGFRVEDDNGRLFMIDKRIPLQDGKSAEAYVADALALCKAEIDEWQASFAHVGKVFDPATGKFV